MATFAKIDGAEPSTVTFRLATVTQDRGGQTQHQEIVTLGGSESTLAIAQVRAAAPASTEFGLVVRVADPSTGPFAVSSIAGPVTVRSSKADALVSVYQSTAADLNVTVAGYVAPSTIVTVSTGSVRVHQSSAADLNVTVAGYSTTVAVSSIVGPVTVRSSAANALVSVYQSTASELKATVFGNTSSNSSEYLPVRLSNGTAFLTPSQDYTDGSTASNLAGPTITFDNGSNATMRAVSLTLGLPVNVVAGAAGGSTIVTVSTGSVRVHQSSAADLNVTVAGYSTLVAVSSVGGVVSVLPNSSVATRWFPVQISDGSTWISDSTNRAIRVNVVAGSAAGDTTVSVTPNSSVATRWFPVQVSDGSTWISDSTNRAIRVNVVAGSVAGDTTATVSFAAGYVSTAAPAANSSALVVRVVGYDTVVSVSTGSVRVHQSTAADLNVTVAGYSTTVNISSLAGPVITRSSAANMLVSVYQSTAADLNVTVAGYSTTVNVSSGVIRAQQYTSSGGAVEGSTTAPAAGVIGLHVREALQDLLSTRAVITSSNSTALYTLVSSAAGLKHKVYAYSLTSTETTPSTIVFMSSNAIDRWAVSFGSGSSGITGANLTVSPPGYLFKTDAANALRCLIEKGASTQCSVTLSIGYFSEP